LALAPDARARAERIYRITTSDTHMRAPDSMVPWLEEHFGSRHDVENQRIVRIDNLVTGEGTLFNALRARRPVHTALADAASEEIARALAKDVWADPLTATPEDTFGRLHNNHGLTAANVARYDTYHSLIVFAEPDPLAFTASSIAGYIGLAERWFERVQAEDSSACYPYLMWNCLWRAGGSVVHGHMQVAAARGRHFAKVERLRADASAYAVRHGSSYFDDLAAVHRDLGLEVRIGEATVLAHLTPIKEKELLVLLPDFTEAQAEALCQVLRTLVDELGVRSFNLAALMPPRAQTRESWENFPVMVRIVDRGALDSRTSDWGGMELFAQSVVAADPFVVARAVARRAGA
jgi:hypothetical protein